MQQKLKSPKSPNQIALLRDRSMATFFFSLCLCVMLHRHFPNSPLTLFRADRILILWTRIKTSMVADMLLLGPETVLYGDWYEDGEIP